MYMLPLLLPDFSSPNDMSFAAFQKISYQERDCLIHFVLYNFFFKKKENSRPLRGESEMQLVRTIKSWR